jgi:GR25 family glycosyltransferase involved in LPS biosynthesis
VKTYLINLDRAEGRRRRFAAANSDLRDVLRFAAVDGSGLDLPELIRDGLIDPRIAETYTPARLGGALSHLAVWEKAIAAGEALTICEDDAILHPDFAAQSARLLRELPAEWDIVLWGWNFDAALDIDLLPGVSPCLVLFEQPKLRAAAARFQQLPISPQLFRLRQALGLPCYSVSPKGARALREFCLPLRPMQLRLPGRDRRLRNVGIDCMMAGLYPEIVAFASFPPLAITKNEPAQPDPRSAAPSR